MWSRHIEAVIGLWLLVSFLIFRYGPLEVMHHLNDTICAGLIWLFSLIAYRERLRYTHLLNFLVGAWLIAWAVYGGKGIYYAPDQNYMTVGLLLMMLSLVPSRTKEPPRAWQRFLNR